MLSEKVVPDTAAESRSSSESAFLAGIGQMVWRWLPRMRANVLRHRAPVADFVDLQGFCLLDETLRGPLFWWGRSRGRAPIAFGRTTLLGSCRASNHEMHGLQNYDLGLPLGTPDQA